MVVISSAELRNNMKKYLDLARTQRVVIQRGRDESFVLIAQNSPGFDSSSVGYFMFSFTFMSCLITFTNFYF